ncbi:gliding motility-associated lipoprotein GldK [Mucilaginibacter gracilis]|uniref:Gliding motility-associated lipoprotein GldK n=1 Tax=Mucilaginibacter gracilis TaxID=423350 RepID=A0A495J245_9SPHI|nr:SUMF1/EgtB/PvdO family nonheme iron enzyme [Mucilaginibacter gracilis]RKR82782.1 gliding motility-associated lipoprotein GldK [Mucilaginibacter gracilis]
MSANYRKIAIILGSALFCACKTSKIIYEVPTDVRPYTGKTLTAPPGMIYIPAGTIYESSTIKDSINADTSTRRVSLSSFFMDMTEVSNKQYRKFVDWVADSVAVTTYLKNDPKFFYNAKLKSKTASAKGAKADSVARMINWRNIDINGKVPFWQSHSEKFPGLVSMVNGRKTLNKDMLKFAFTHVQAGGPNAGKSVTDTIKIMPDNNVWQEDFPNSQSDFLVNNYFQLKGFDNYPVVGVTWKQARAYTGWRNIISASTLDRSLVELGLSFSLPTEAQWEYAASGGEQNMENATGNVQSKDQNVVPSYIQKKTKKILPIANFKQGEGDYTRDGAIQTVPVKSYAPNVFGLYNMAGNVAEWALDAYSPSAFEFVEDRDPVLLLDATDEDADVMKRKVVRGGSWKDNATDLNTATRNYEVQNVAHSYIGFRCTMAAPDLITEQVGTRKYLAPKKDKNAKVKASGK